MVRKGIAIRMGVWTVGYFGPKYYGVGRSEALGGCAGVIFGRC